MHLLKVMYIGWVGSWLINFYCADNWQTYDCLGASKIRVQPDEKKDGWIACIWGTGLFIFHIATNLKFLITVIIFQVDADFKLKDMKKAYKELEMKGKGYKKRLDELQTDIHKHLEQYVIRELFWNTWFIILKFL